MNQNSPFTRIVDKSDPWQLVIIDCYAHKQWSEKSIRLEWSPTNHDFIPSKAWIGVYKDGRYIVRKWITEEKGWKYEILK